MLVFALRGIRDGGAEIGELVDTSGVCCGRW